MSRILIATLPALALGCTDFDLPSALTREQIVAVRSTPAAVGAGARARLDALVAGPDGVVEDAALVWSLADPPDGVTLEEDADGTWLAVAGDAAPGSAVLDLAVTTSAGDELAALKSVEVGGEARDNPGPMGLVADEEPVAGELRVPARAAVALSAELEGSEEAQLSWFATVGEIELYRRNPTELAAPEDASDGWLIAVVRDRTGGVAWQIVSLVVDP